MDERLCTRQVSQDGWHWHRCNRPARWMVTQLKGEVPRCGIHARKIHETMKRPIERVQQDSADEPPSSVRPAR